MDKLLPFIVRHWPVVALFVIAFVVLIVVEARSKGLGSRFAVSSHEAVKMINDQKAIVIDIRSPEEFAQGHIVNAINIPAKQFQQSQTLFNKYRKKNIILVCALGQRSSDVLRRLHKLGFENVCSMRGGMKAWKSASMPEVK